jgi:hypothetical protein
MTSPSNDAPLSDPSYNNLIRKALRLVRGRDRVSARERALAEMVVYTELALDEARRQASIGDPGNHVPEQIARIMRAPKGRDRLAVIYYDGMTIKVSLHPLGKRNPEREAAVWRCIRETAMRARSLT